MVMTVTKIETLGDYKRAMKAFVRGTIKSKLFCTDKPLKFIVEKTKDLNAINMYIDDEGYTSIFSAEVSSRTFNKVVPSLYEKTIEQFSKLKGFAGMTVEVIED